MLLEHRVAEGESLQVFANLYNTSVEAIRNVNYDLIAPLWIDWLVVIPMNTMDVSGIPDEPVVFLRRELADHNPDNWYIRDITDTWDDVCASEADVQQDERGWHAHRVVWHWA